MQRHKLTRFILKVLAHKLDRAADDISDVQAYMEMDPRLQEMALQAMDLADQLVCMNIELMEICRRANIILVHEPERQHQRSPDG